MKGKTVLEKYVRYLVFFLAGCLYSSICWVALLYDGVPIGPNDLQIATVAMITSSCVVGLGLGSLLSMAFKKV